MSPACHRAGVIDEQDMMHGHPWEGQQVAGWVATEKLDGVRGYWDGAKMWSRSGREIQVPASWVAALPSVPLDGEIWAGRGGFVAARNATNHGRWSRAVRFVVFDAPGHAGTYAERLVFARSVLPSRGPASVVASRTVSGINEAAQMMRRIQAAGGEGVMLQFPHSQNYRPGRWFHTLKLKTAPATNERKPVGLRIVFGAA